MVDILTLPRCVMMLWGFGKSILILFQIINCMLKGKIQMGTPVQDLCCWDQDALREYSCDDWIWGWSIRSSEVLHLDCSKINDEVLHEMILKSLVDTETGAPAWSETLFIKQGLCMAANMVTHILQKVFKAEAKVSHSGCLLFDRSWPD